ncbi:hypothetical protein [Liquorilactobacillus hordei]|uniref:hypothetical protein n=1 Tax=Liquorilactobacillus hordei TaxID=468911 RepID=UPI001CBD14A6|nr:hypothetical protein [Liquorilactobacillus hordei]MBZ2406043.1 hypothetical protein [Liquorilactobacillus hordei]
MKKLLLYTSAVVFMLSFANVLLIGMNDKNTFTVISGNVLNNVFIFLITIQLIIIITYSTMSTEKELRKKNAFIWTGIIGSFLNMVDSKN